MTPQIYQAMTQRPDINWSLVARTCFQALLNGQLELVTTSEGPVLRPAPGETGPKTEKRKKQ